MRSDQPTGRRAPTYRGTVYPWQCDQVGHMNVAFYVAKFDEATWQFFALIGMDGRYFRDQRGGMGAVEQALTYSRELHAGDCIHIETEVLQVHDKAITFRHHMHDSGSGELVSTCTITAVHIEPKERRASKLPEIVASKARDLLNAT